MKEQVATVTTGPGTPSRVLRVMESVREIRPTTNPYLTQLVARLEQSADVEVVYFTFARAILARYDVFHVHWPEVMFTSAKRTGRIARLVLTTALVLRLRVLRTPVVRTWHNTERPDGLTRWDHFLLDQFDKATRAVVLINAQTEVPLAVPIAVVPHGHYREWYGAIPAADITPGRIGYVGLIRRYKGVERLVQAFSESDRTDLTLAVSGKPSSPGLSRSLEALAGDDPRISFRFDYLDDPDFVREITRAQLVVLPYRHMHNSGTALAVLSLDRPVLVPDNPTNRALAEEVGSGWVHLFSGDLTSSAIEAALAHAAGLPVGGRPDLSRREWIDAVDGHVTAFRAALAGRRAVRRR